MCEDIMKVWKNQRLLPISKSYNAAKFEELLKSRVRKHTSTAMGYFWSAFTLQLIVFALLMHLMVRHWQEQPLLLVSLAVFLLHLP